MSVVSLTCTPQSLLAAPAVHATSSGRTMGSNVTVEAGRTAPFTTARQEIVVVDTRVTDYLRLVEDVKRQAGDGRQLEVVLLDSRDDGIQRISRLLRGRRGIDALHIVSHGTSGGIELGGLRLDAQSLKSRADTIARWGASLTPGSDILFYGCDVAADAQGRAFVEELAHLTGANVAASTDLTGSASLGGNWHLEYQVDRVDTRPVLDRLGQAQWVGLLDVTVNSTSSAQTAVAATSLTWSHEVFSGDNRLLTVSMQFDGAGYSTGVTYGGTALTLIGRYTSVKHTLEIWRLIAPAVGTADIVASFSGTMHAIGGGRAFDGVDQTTPTSALETAAGAPPAQPSKVVSSAAGEKVIDSVMSDNASSLSVGGGQTEQWNRHHAGMDREGAGSIESGAASVTMSWTGANDDWTIVAVAVKATAAGILVSPTAGLTTTEAGGTATFTVVLGMAPTADVTIGLSSSDTSEGTVSPSSLTFTTGNWSTPQTVTVTGADDAVKDGTVPYSVVTAAATSSDPTYNGMNASDVSVTTTDDEVSQTVQSGTATIASGNSSTTATITPVVMSRAFLVFSTTVNDADPADAIVRGELTDQSTVTFTRYGTGTAVTIRWSVVEYASGVTVQRGTTAATGTTNNITISSVNTAKAFPIISYSTSGTTFDSSDFYKSKLTTSTNLEVASTGSSADTVVSWQVVEFTHHSVQSGDISFASGDSSKTATVTSVDTAKSWLVYTHTSANGTGSNIGQKLVRGVITNSTTLTFDRVNTGQAITLTWFLVSFDDHTVQQGSQAFTTAETQKDVTISSADTTKSFAAGGAWLKGGRSGYSGADNPGVGWMTHELTSSTNLQITRALTGSATADMGWFVVTIPTPGITVTPTAG